MDHAYGPRPRKEDARFIRGQGRYVDDIALPGMLYGAVLRSPLAHARITSVDASAALAHPLVVDVLTGADLAERGMAWMPTLFGDVQAVLATDKVRFQGQEVAFVVATDRYAARDALELISVDYEPLPPLIDASTALKPGAPVVRDELPGGNRIFDWSAGDQAATDAAFAAADVVVSGDFTYPRSHPAPLETCGAIADYDPVEGRLTVWATSQAPHAHRTLYTALTQIPEHKIRVISPDLGGGFGAKVPVYPGYVCAIAASMILGRPVKWMEDRSENLMSTTFARDYQMHGEIAATAGGQILGLRARVLADHGAFNAVAQPSKFPAGFFHIFTGSYQTQAAYWPANWERTRRSCGCGTCAPRAVPLHDPVRLAVRLRRLPAGAAAGPGHGGLRRAAPRAGGAAGPRGVHGHRPQLLHRGRRRGPAQPYGHHGPGHGRRRRPAGASQRQGGAGRLRADPGAGAQTTFAQLVAQELGLSPDDVEVVHGDTDRTPFGLGTYGSRSTPVSGAAAVVAARKVRARARLVAAAMLEVSADDLEWLDGQWRVRGDPDQACGIIEIARAAHSSLELPDGVEGHLDASAVYNPPNLTFPFGAYICVTDVDPGTGEVKVRRFIAVDDCGVRINPMIVDGQIHRGLADGIGIALMQSISFDEDGNCLSGSFMDYLLPTSLECPSPELGLTVTPSPHHPVGAKGIGESATVGSPPAVVNSVIDALAPFGVTHADMPLTPGTVWLAIQRAPGAPAVP
jgi:carbon-monoxide dehydrogenase large subunit